jgi:hypothetical protein
MRGMGDWKTRSTCSAGASKCCGRLVARGLAACTALLVLCSAASPQSGASPSVVFHSPQLGATVSGRSFVIEVEVKGFDVPDMGKGVLLLDGAKLMEVRQQHVTISMDGLGGLSEGQHSLTLLLERRDGSPVTAANSQVTFLKEGSPEATAGPFYDDRFDDSALLEMNEACRALDQLHSASAVSRAGEGGRQIETIALGLPVVSARKKYDGEEEDDMRVVQDREKEGFIEDMAELPMIKVFIPSLVTSIVHEPRPFRYVVYLGFDLGDPVFDNELYRVQIDTEMKRLVGEHDVSFEWMQYTGMEGKVFWIYNDLFRQAYADGADYFYMVNDDLLLLTHGWAGRFVSALESSEIPGFGVAGPLDIRDRHKTHMCFAFHSRLHYDIFGSFYPPAFQNWWSDYWATLVYGPKHTFWFKDVEVRNTEIVGRRYPAFWEGNEMFGDEVSAGRRRIASFCRCHAQGGIWRYEVCLPLALSLSLSPTHLSLSLARARALSLSLSSLCIHPCLNAPGEDSRVCILRRVDFRRFHPWAPS